MGLRCCPEYFYNHCRNAGKKCRICSAGGASKVSNPIYYEAVSFEANQEHPFQCERQILLQEQKNKKAENSRAKRRDPQFKIKSRRIKKALGKEKSVTKKLNNISFKQTVASGSVYGDGDIKSSTGLQIDHKYREKRESFHLTLKEYRKGKNQGTEVWIVTIQDKEGIEHQIVMLDIDLFIGLTEKNGH